MAVAQKQANACSSWLIDVAGLYDYQKSACILTDVQYRKSQGIIPEPWQVIYYDAIHHPTACLVCGGSGLDVVYRTPDSSPPDAQEKCVERPPPGFQKGI